MEHVEGLKGQKNKARARAPAKWGNCPCCRQTSTYLDGKGVFLLAQGEVALEGNHRRYPLNAMIHLSTTKMRQRATLYF